MPSRQLPFREIPKDTHFITFSINEIHHIRDRDKHKSLLNESTKQLKPTANDGEMSFIDLQRHHNL